MLFSGLQGGVGVSVMLQVERSCPILREYELEILKSFESYVNDFKWSIIFEVVSNSI